MKIHLTLLFFAAFFLQHMTGYSQDGFTVTGNVSESKNDWPIPGVNIIEKGTGDGTITDLDGNYTITVSSKDAILVFTSVGYRKQEVPVDSRPVINLKLDEEVQDIQEVVVIGYGTTKKSDLTGALASVSNEDFKDIAALGVDDALKGRAAGVEVINNTGSPGSSMTVRIRGMATLNSGTMPLYVVDGIIMGDQSFGKKDGNIPDNKSGISFLDPNDIESIEVLKDASAAAIYGARGANGVVLITTKKGKAGKARVDINIYKGVQTQARELDMMSAGRYRDFSNELQGILGRDTFAGFVPGTALSETNWQEEVFTPADKEKYKFTISGGSEKNTYLFSASYFKQEGLVKSSGYDKFSIRFNGEHKLSNKIKFGEQFIVTRSNRKRVMEGAGLGNVVSGALLADPSIEPYVADITDPATLSYLNDTTQIWTDLYRTSNVRNPVATIDLDIYNYESYHYFGNAFVDFQLFPFLNFRSIVGIDITNGDMEQFNPRYQINPVDRRDQNEFYKRHERWINWDVENILTYQKTFGSHDLTVMGAVTAQKETFVDMRLHFKPFPYDEEFMRYPNVPTIDGVSPPESSPMAYSLLSQLGRVIYNYDGKIHLTASIRRDGSSKFGPENRWGVFPSFSAGYKLSEEDFIKNIGFVDFLKVRAGWGKLGNQSIPPYQYSTSLYSQGNNYGFGPNREVLVGLLPNGVSNQYIKWESTKQTNVGLDFGLWGSKLSGSVDVFDKLTSDLLMQMPVPKFTGVHNLERVGGAQPSAFANIADLNNKGLEMKLDYKSSIGPVRFNLGGNISVVKNEVVDLPGENTILPSNNDSKFGYMSYTKEGESVAGFYGYITEGIFQDYDEIAAHADQGTEDPYTDDRSLEPNPLKYTAPGDFKYRDINGDGEINDDDKTFIGSPLPDFTYGFNLNLDYKGFDMFMSLSGVQGIDVMNKMKYYLYNDILYVNRSADFNYWTEDNRDASYPRIGKNKSKNLDRFSDFYIEDASYLRIRNLTIGYSFGDNILNRIKMKRIRLYATIENLYTFTKYTGLEPEVGSSVGWNPHPLDFGVDAATYPHPRTYILGLNISL
jgi:TonB-dependent starch-binding outer membrane protein SusC